MSTKLSSTNRYLRDAAVRKSMVIRSVVTSSAIEGIRVSFKRSPKGDDNSPVPKRRVNAKKA
jgi:hypothetical protein